MSKEDVKKFYDHVVSNPSALQSLTAAPTVDDIYRIAVNDAAALGLNFTEAEAREWADANRPQPKADGELSDEHLESVAGGKGGSGSVSIGGSSGVNVSGSYDAGNVAQTAINAVSSAASTVSSWFSGW